MRPSLVFVLALAFGLPALGSEVVSVDAKQQVVILQNDPPGTWKRDDMACVVREMDRLGCGVVRGFSSQGAHLVLNGEGKGIKPGDSTYRLKATSSRELASTQNVVSIVYEEEVPNKRFNLAAGVALSLDLQYPTLAFNYAITSRVVLGLQPAFITSQLADRTGKLTGYGASLTAAYYFNGAYRGPWAQFGSGYYSYTANDATGTDSSSSPAITVLMGWRERWAGRSNLGIGLGFRYMPHLSGRVTSVKFRELYPMASVDLGFEW